MRGIVYQFPNFQALSLQLEAGGDEQDIELPAGVTDVTEGEWVLAQVSVGDESTTVAACAMDRGDGLRLVFEDRDWRRLWQFANSNDPPSAPPPSGPASLRLQVPPGTSILVVDDDAETQHIFRALLEPAGYRVSAVASAEQAFDRLRDVAVDLVLLDWNLPGISGLDFCRRIRKDMRLARLPILFVTANAASRDLVTAFEAGADDYMTKPFRAPELNARILGLIRRARMHAHAAAR